MTVFSFEGLELVSVPKLSLLSRLGLLEKLGFSVMYSNPLLLPSLLLLLFSSALFLASRDLGATVVNTWLDFYC
jgi:hypothetical protein